MRRETIAVAAALLLGVGAVFLIARGAPPSWESANTVVDEWLAAMADPSGDRGWSDLSTETQAALYAGDAAAYWSDLEQVDWGRVAWAPANGYVDDGAFYSGSVWLRSHPSTLPRFLLERGLATPSCVDRAPFGINVQMRVGWFSPSRISGLIGKAGDADPCWTAFDERPGAWHGPFDLVGGAWAGAGRIQRVGVRDSSGLVGSVEWGRAGLRLDREVEVSAFEPRALAITWRGASCDSNSTLTVEGTASALRITVERGLSDGCSGSDVIYDSILRLEADVPVESVAVERP